MGRCLYLDEAALHIVSNIYDSSSALIRGIREDVLCIQALPCMRQSKPDLRVSYLGSIVDPGNDSKEQTSMEYSANGKA